MTDSVNVSPGHVGKPLENARTFRYGAHSAGWVVPSTETLLADVRSDLVAGPYNAFAESHSSTSFDVTIDTGEAVVAGVALARDTTTTVTITSNSTETVYVGWAESSKDTVVVGKSGAFTSSNPKIPLWDFTTDGSGVTGSTDRRALDAQIEVQNNRYEGGGVKVDAAVSADEIANVTISQLLRGDQNDTTSGALGFTNSAGITGTLGNSSGEAWRSGGGTSDLVLGLQGGHGRVMWAWNAYYDGTDWRSIVANEGHAAIAFSNTDPGPSVGGGNLVLATAPSNANAGDVIAWNTLVMDDAGNLDFGGNQAEGMVLEHRTSRPTSPTAGRIIYRTDKD